MHIPDGVLSPTVCVATGAVSLGLAGFSLHKLRDSLAERAVPMTGMMSALIFAGQMVNFPIGVGVSGHLMGGVLAAVMLGPWAGFLAVTLVLMVQALLFADGGLLALGANVLNMAGVGALGGYAIYATIRRAFGERPVGIVVGAVVAAWLSVMAAATLFCVEFAASNPGSELNLQRVFLLMVLFHAAIGVGEALITGVVVSFVLSQRPDLVARPQATGSLMGGLGRFATVGVVLALAIAAFLSPYASSFPDGLEAVASRAGFDELAESRVLMFEDYAIPLPSPADERFSGPLAGVVGTVVVLAIALVLGKLLPRRAAVAGPVRHAD